MKRDAADARYSDQIRERDKWTCQRCWKTYIPPTQALHSAHMFSRGKPSTRFDPDNACALCYGCHRYLDTHPDIKRAFFLLRLGPARFEALERRSNQTKGGMSKQTGTDR